MAHEGSLDQPGALRTGYRRYNSSRLEDPDGLGLSLQLVAARVDVRDGSRRCRPCRIVHETAPRRGGGLDTRRGVHPVAYDESLLGGLCRRSLSGHYADVGLQGRPVLGAVDRDGRNELQAGTHGTLGVVLLGDGNTPHGHDGVTYELLHDPAVAPDDGPGEVEVAREELSYLLGVTFLGERREADEVTEQHRDVAELGGGAEDRKRRLGRKPAAAEEGAGTAGRPGTRNHHKTTLPARSSAPHAEQSGSKGCRSPRRTACPPGSHPHTPDSAFHTPSARRKATTLVLRMHPNAGRNVRPLVRPRHHGFAQDLYRPATAYY